MSNEEAATARKASSLWQTGGQKVRFVESSRVERVEGGDGGGGGVDGVRVRKTERQKWTKRLA
jgi:hypothetical protein